MKKENNSKKQLSAKETAELFATLEARFEKNRQRHKELKWTDIAKRLQSAPAKYWSLYQMEATGGEPDVVVFDKAGKEYLFCDCSAESPAGRRSLCYDDQALDARKENKPEGSAIGMAEAMGVSLLTEAEYKQLQQLGSFDTKTSSWLQTPDPIRKLGGAIFADRRYDHVFVYHNGVQSYYAARGFRAILAI
ncbi:MAG TPA: DUF4256 domain-containing protein [Chitinophagaceae bacterium]|nr:DUF4256 domain-containing protein [Chitinophagaceae bacterium]